MRAEPNFFHVVLLHKTKAWFVKKKKRQHTLNMFCVWSSLAAFIVSGAGCGGTFTSYCSRLSFDRSTLRPSSPLRRFLRPVRPLQPSRPRLQPTVKLPWTWAKDDIHTRLFQHKPPCAAKLQNRCQAIGLHCGGPFQRTWLNVDMVCLLYLVLFDFLWLLWFNLFFLVT